MVGLMKPMAALLGVFLLLSFAPATEAQPRPNRSSSAPKSAPPKLYRWTDAQGKVHYTDSLPAEALNQGRQEYSRKGLLVQQVERPPTAEELASQATAAALAQEQTEQTLAKEREAQALRAAYPSLEAIGNDYRQRAQQLGAQIVSMESAIAEQRKVLLSKLQLASDAELQGKKVGAPLALQIQTTHKTIAQHRATVVQLQAQREALVLEEQHTKEQWKALQTTNPPQSR